MLTFGGGLHVFAFMPRYCSRDFRFSPRSTGGRGVHRFNYVSLLVDGAGGTRPPAACCVQPSSRRDLRSRLASVAFRWLQGGCPALDAAPKENEGECDGLRCNYASISAGAVRTVGQLVGERARTERRLRLRARISVCIYTARQFRRLLDSVPSLELCDVYDFRYDIAATAFAPNDEMAYSVFVLRRRRHRS